jgi:hypothetical protein
MGQLPRRPGQTTKYHFLVPHEETVTYSHTNSPPVDAAPVVPNQSPQEHIEPEPRPAPFEAHGALSI